MPDVRFTVAVRDALREEMQRSTRVIVLGPYARSGVQNGGITAGLAEEFGEQRVLNTPVGEAALAGIAAGAALAGFRPFVDVGALGFALSLLDQVTNQAAKVHYLSNGQLAVPAVYWFETCHRGWGVHHAQAIHALLCHLPGLKVVMPSTPYDAKGLVKAALRDENPVAVLAHPELYAVTADVPAGDYAVEIGTARVARSGRDLTLVACGWAVQRAVMVANTLATEGVSVEVVDLRSLVPLDWTTLIASAEMTGRVVVCDQGHRSCGIAATVAAGLQEKAFRSLKAPVGLVTAADVPVPFNLALEDAVMPTEEQLLASARACLRY
jgi:acetoin:2,6-dichlorophenolindophenol oxidoreductase subunit beta